MKCSAELPYGRIILHIDETIENLDHYHIVDELERYTGKCVKVKGSIFKEYGRESTPVDIARTRITSLESRTFCSPLPVEIQIEKRILAGNHVIGMIYDGWKLLRVMSDHLPENSIPDHIIVVTPRLIGTLERGDKRYHIRTVLHSMPSIISTSGIVEGPARPREYYLKNHESCNVPYMEYGDHRMSKAVISYALQTMMWRHTGKPFCAKKGCPLYNSHWQEELIDSQVEGRLCEEHRPKLYLSSG